MLLLRSPGACINAVNTNFTHAFASSLTSSSYESSSRFDFMRFSGRSRNIEDVLYGCWSRNHVPVKRLWRSRQINSHLRNLHHYIFCCSNIPATTYHLLTKSILPITSSAYCWLSQHTKENVLLLFFRILPNYPPSDKWVRYPTLTRGFKKKEYVPIMVSSSTTVPRSGVYYFSQGWKVTLPGIRRRLFYLCWSTSSC